MKKTKILAASDVHGDKKTIKKLAEKAKKENVDLVVLAGDLTFFEQSAEGIIGPFKKINKKVLLIPGNHETIATADFLAEMYHPGTYNIHGYSIKFHDVGFFGFGGTSKHEVPGKDIKEVLEETFEDIKKLRKKILITHIHPSHERFEKLGMMGDEATDALKESIEKLKPDIVISGHMHEFEDMETKIGKTIIHSIGKKGKVIEV